MRDFSNYVLGAIVPIGRSILKKPFVNLDNAASTPPLKPVAQAVVNLMPLYSSVHRGNGFKSRLSTELYEQARQIVGDFVGANSKDHVVIFGKNTTEAINKLSYRIGLSKQDIVLISQLEHHSNDLPWRRQANVKRIGLTGDGTIDKQDYLKLLKRYKDRVKLVAISGASNVTGYIPDIHWFASKAHEASAQILVDCAQLAAHRPIRMGRLSDLDHLDYIAMSGHKMYAPFGTGALVGRKDVFLKGGPEYVGGGTIDFVTTNTVDWATPPDSDEAGSPNVIGAIAFARAITTINQIGLNKIAEHEALLTRLALKQLKLIPGITIYGDSDPTNAATRSGVIPFTVQGLPSHLVAAVLGYEWNIAVRSGCFCAHPYVMQLLGLNKEEVKTARQKVLIDQRVDLPGMVRVSFGLYNTSKDVLAFTEAIKQVAAGKFGRYELDIVTGGYKPVGLNEDFERYFKI